MSTHTHTLDVQRPIHTVYLQWTQFESFPEFMEGVRSVKQTDDLHARWEIDTSSDHRTFETTITRQEPDRSLAWASTDGSWQAGQVTLRPLAEDTTRVTLALEFEPQGFSESLGDRLGFVAKRVEGDLERFKELVEGSPESEAELEPEVELEPEAHPDTRRELKPGPKSGPTL